MSLLINRHLMGMNAAWEPKFDLWPVVLLRSRAIIRAPG